MSQLIRRQSKLAFDPPNAYDPHSVRVAPVNDSEWWVDEFAKKRLLELGNDAAETWMFAKRIDTIHQL